MKKCTGTILHAFVVTALILSMPLLAMSAPVLYYSSAESGPSTGWEGSSSKGAAISLWASDVGATRGNNTLTVAGVTLDQGDDFAEWGAGTNPATPKGFQRITFWLNNSMPEGNSEGLYVTVDGKRSNVLPFRIDNSGKIVFLDLNGSNTNDGRFASNEGDGHGPWVNFGLATEELEPGDFMYLRAGDWTRIHNNGTGDYEYIGHPWGEAPINGTNESRITVTSYPGELAVFLDCTVHNHSDYWTFTNMKWVGGNSPGGSSYAAGHQGSFCEGNSDHSVGLNVIGMEFTGAIDHAIQAFGDDFIIAGNTFHTTPTDSSSYVLYMCSGNGRTITDNELRGGSGWLIHYYDEDRPSCADVGRGSTNVTIAGNLLDARNVSEYDHNDALIFASGSVGAIDGLVFKNNILIGDDSVGNGSGFGIETRSTISNVEIYNNVFYQFPNGINIDSSSQNQYNIIIKNNIFDGIQEVAIDVDLNLVPEVTIERNLFTVAPVIDGSNDSSPILGDPSFIDPGTDFHLMPNSPAIDSGVELIQVARDFDKQIRPVDGDGNDVAIIDIGPYEYYVSSDLRQPSTPTNLRIE